MIFLSITIRLALRKRLPQHHVISKYIHQVTHHTLGIGSQLFRPHIARRADHIDPAAHRGGADGAHVCGETKVNDLDVHIKFSEHDIFWLDIAAYHPLWPCAMQILQPRRNLASNANLDMVRVEQVLLDVKGLAPSEEQALHCKEEVHLALIDLRSTIQLDQPGWCRV